MKSNALIVTLSTVDEDELAEAAEDELIIHCPECGEISFRKKMVKK